MDNYTGPFWSNGRFQSSVEFGDKLPDDEVDYQSRLHDTAFAHFGDERHRIAADWLYQVNLEKVQGFKARFVESLPFYGNLADATTLSGLFTPALPIVVFDYGLRVRRVKHAIAAGEYDKEIADVLNLYKRDPFAMGGVLAPVVYPEAFAKHNNRVGPSVGDLPPRGGQPSTEVPTTELTPIQEVTIDGEGNITSRSPPTVAADVVFANVVDAATTVGRENLELGGTAYNPNVMYSPYRPLKRKRKKISQKDVDTYNRYHHTSYSLEEVQTVHGLYL